jgi:hypothetical protein
MSSEKPEYNQKIRAAFLLAPTVFMNHATNGVFQMAEWAGSLENLLHSLGVYEYMPHLEIFSWLGDTFCSQNDRPVYTEVCNNLAFLLYGIKPDRLNM